MRISHQWRVWWLALSAYAFVAVAFAWPLPSHLGTHLTGSPGGDTGVYVWNQWVFRHELVEHRALPYFTDTLFGRHNRANLSLHNYTTFQNLLALPLIPILGLVATFNTIYLLMVVLTAFMTFLLARRVTGTTIEAWLAGALFAWSPILVTRGTAHFSLVAAAPLSLFLLLLLRTTDQLPLRDALALGVTMWWAASTDVYYAVYCLLIAAAFLTARLIAIESVHQAERARVVSTILDILLISLAAFVVAVVISGGWEFTFLGRPIRVRTLYNPVFALTCVGLARVAWHYRISFERLSFGEAGRLARFCAVVLLIGALLLSPVLYAVAVRIADGDFERSRNLLAK